VKELETEMPDIVHLHNIHTLLPFYTAKLKKRSKEKVVLQPHYHESGQNILRNSMFSIYKTVLRTRGSRCFDAIVTNSKYEKASFERDFSGINAKVVLVPEEYSLEIPSHVKWKPSRQSRLLYVGALTRYKNVAILIRALKLLTLQVKNIELIIVGDGPEKQRLAKLALSLGVNDKTTMKQGLPYNELLQEYATANVVVLLSTLESFSRVAHEAIAVGTPLIVYNHGPLSMLVQRNLAKGVDSLDPKEVADVIMETLKNDKKTANTRKPSDPEVYVDQIVKLYKSLLD
jgi:glycosyltransferase involved in cell wall biosynthesis